MDDVWIILEQLTVICQGRFDHLGLGISFLYKIRAGGHELKAIFFLDIAVIVSGFQDQGPAKVRVGFKEPDKLKLQFFY